MEYLCTEKRADQWELRAQGSWEDGSHRPAGIYQLESSSGDYRCCTVQSIKPLSRQKHSWSLSLVVLHTFNYLIYF